jgi:hypothetical protein
MMLSDLLRRSQARARQSEVSRLDRTRAFADLVRRPRKPHAPSGAGRVLLIMSFDLYAICLFDYSVNVAYDLGARLDFDLTVLKAIDWAVYLPAFQQRARALRQSRIEDMAEIADVAKGGYSILMATSGLSQLTPALEGGR